MHMCHGPVTYVMKMYFILSKILETRAEFEPFRRALLQQLSGIYDQLREFMLMDMLQIFRKPQTPLSANGMPQIASSSFIQGVWSSAILEALRQPLGISLICKLCFRRRSEEEADKGQSRGPSAGLQSFRAGK